MLALPNAGIRKSRHSHNCDLDIFCDWLEACILLAEDELFHNNVIDFLIEQNIYFKQDFCSEYVTTAWRVLRNRLNWLGAGSPIEFQTSRMIRKLEWNQVPAHSFCLILSLSPYYSGWVSHFGHDYTEQGELFELLTLESISEIFTGWQVKITGWSKNQASRLSDVVPELAGNVCESVRELNRWTNEKAHELGLDIYWYKPLNDSRGNIPVYLAQCASGNNWTTKLHTPEMGVWREIIAWRCLPQKAFIMPYSLMEEEFTRRCPQVGGLLLDRYRLIIPASTKQNWVSNPLTAKVNDWLAPRIEWLLALNEE